MQKSVNNYYDIKRAIFNIDNVTYGAILKKNCIFYFINLKKIVYKYKL